MARIVALAVCIPVAAQGSFLGSTTRLSPENLLVSPPRGMLNECFSTIFRPNASYLLSLPRVDLTNMRPLTIITGIVFGSALSITLGLTVVFIVFLFVGTDEPRVAAEIHLARNYIGWFVALTIASAVSFIGELRLPRWRWWAQGIMWLSFCIVILRFWPV
ncbi:MAG: hypothetical protein AAGA84_06605 [Pseudomonadota bacterium]